MKVDIAGTTLELTEGDITEQDVAAIVSPANRGLRGGGGADGAIHRAGGPSIMRECREIGGCETGSAVLTTAGDLATERVIHAVGPVWRGGERERELLAGAYRSSLDLAREHGLRSVAFPSISTGAYGYPIAQAAKVALGTVVEWLREHPGELELVRFVLFSPADYRAYSHALQELGVG